MAQGVGELTTLARLAHRVRQESSRPSENGILGLSLPVVVGEQALQISAQRFITLAGSIQKGYSLLALQSESLREELGDALVRTHPAYLGLLVLPLVVVAGRSRWWAVLGLAVVVLSLLLGTAVLSLVGGIGAALTVGLKRGGMLISLLILPFYMPVLIFGSAAVNAAVAGSPPGPYLAILGAMLCLAIALAPLAISAGLRISIDS